MAEKTIRLTIDVTIRDLTPAERKECAECVGDDPDELPTIKEIEDWELAEVLEGHIENDEEMWGGSMMYARVKKAKAVSNEFVRG